MLRIEICTCLAEMCHACHSSLKLLPCEELATVNTSMYALQLHNTHRMLQKGLALERHLRAPTTPERPWH